MRVQGNLNVVQSSLDFYCRLVSTSSYRSVEALRSYYYNKFLEDAKKDLEDKIESKVGVKEKAVVKIEENTDKPNEVETVVEESTVGASSFLSAVKSFNESVQSGVVPSNNISEVDVIPQKVLEEVGGTFIDEISIDDIEVDSDYNYQYSDYGTILDDIEVSNVKVQVEEIKSVSIEPIIVHGVFLDDYVPKEKPLEDVHGIYLDDVIIPDIINVPKEDVMVSSKPLEVKQVEEPSDEWFEDEVVETPIEDVKSNIIPINEKVKIEVQVPPTVREFLKKHPGCEVSEVEKYYSKKIIQKELKVGKIYKKGSRLFI